MMSTKITPEHLQRDAVVYVRQSSMGQVLEPEFVNADETAVMGIL